MLGSLAVLRSFSFQASWCVFCMGGSRSSIFKRFYRSRERSVLDFLRHGLTSGMNGEEMLLNRNTTVIPISLGSWTRLIACSLRVGRSISDIAQTIQYDQVYDNAFQMQQ